VASSENPLTQFAVHKIVDLEIGGLDVSFTNASLFMVVAAVLITIFMVTAMRPRAIVPGRFQGAAEVFYEFIDNMLLENIGVEGRRYFPFVFTIFMFVFFCNFLGLVPTGLAEGGFTVTSQIIVTFALALLVFIVVTIIGFMRHGFHFLRLFVPSGVPWPILPILVPIEVMSYCIRPVTLSVRLFANMVAGHVMLALFGGFVIGLGGFFFLLGGIPLLAIVAVVALELLIAALQAYVFAMLTCIYLNDAVNMAH
jgi:F-type H+-transporting ATPase subunit a